MSKPVKLVLLYGGKSGEHEISLMSAASVLTHLDAKKYQITPVGMDKDGRCYLNDYQELLSFTSSLPVSTAKSKTLPALFLDGQFALDADVVFPVVHGPLYEDGCLQGLLELAGVPYVGCQVLSSAIGMDKDMARRLACDDDIRSARYRTLSWHSNTSERQQFYKQTVADLGWPLFVKPCSLGSSVGIHKVRDMKELELAVSDALRYDHSILVEEFIAGREIELAVLENARPSEAPLVSVAGEICVHHGDGFYSYAAKYLESNATELRVPAQLDDKVLARLQRMAADIFTRLKCRGLSRVDFFFNDETGNIYFNEINTLPGFTSISMYPKMWQASGIPYVELLDRLVGLALTHGRCKQQLVTSFQ